MSPEAENIFEMPPHLFFFRRGVGGLPILGQTQNGRQAERLFFFSSLGNWNESFWESLGVIKH